MPLLPDGRYRFDSPAELPPVAVSLSTTAWNRTGDWRSREPVFGDVRPPCTISCPTEQDIVDQLRLVAQGRMGDAGALLLMANPFPGTTGRVCPHPCTSGCNRERIDGAIDIPGVEAAIGDALIATGYRPKAMARNGGRIAVVGAGPAGLTAAHFLGLSGFEVTLYDREDRPGGLLVTGIPPYRLPRHVVDAEIDRAMKPGVRFVGGKVFGRDPTIEALPAEFDAVLLSIGRHAARPLGVPGEASKGIVDGLHLLAAVHRGEAPPDGERVIVIGGGNTALDCARTLVRCGRRVTVMYRRDREAMPAFVDEIDEALEEGVVLEQWVLPNELVVKEGAVRAMRLLRACPGAPDSSGRPRPEPIPKSEFQVDADLVVVAAGEGLDAGGLDRAILRSGFIDTGSDLKTAIDKVWACGDCIGGGGTVSEAIAQGRRAAIAIASALGARGPVADLVGARGAGPETASWERIRPFYFVKLAPQARGRIGLKARLAGGEVRVGFGAAQAAAAALRCLSCGTCTGCDNCFVFCPDQAVVQGQPGRYGVDVSRCKGCGICVEECPRGALTLRELGGESG